MKNKLIQLARFIQEADMAGAFTPEVLEAMAISMDLSTQEVSDDIELAQEIYDDAVSKL